MLCAVGLETTQREMDGWKLSQCHGVLDILGLSGVFRPKDRASYSTT